MIRYTKEAQLARAHLLRLYNDLIVFVEDATCQNMHVRIISAILGKVGKIAHVFPLYGRSNVVDAAVRDDGNDLRRVYLIDGDLDQLTQRSVPACSRLHRVAAYSIENLLITETALIEIAAECAVDDARNELASRIDFLNRKQSVVRCLRSLFEHYAIVARLDLPIDTISFSVMRMTRVRGTSVGLSPPAIARRLRAVRRQIVSAVGWAAFKQELQGVRILSAGLVDQSATMSGKDYLLPLTHAYLRATMNLRDSFNGFRVRLARHFDPRDSTRTHELLPFCPNCRLSAAAMTGVPLHLDNRRSVFGRICACSTYWRVSTIWSARPAGAPSTVLVSKNGDPGMFGIYSDAH